MTQSQSRRMLWVQKIADGIETALVGRIRAGEVRPGEALGTAADIAREFVTSVSVSRRTLERLTDKGWLAENDGTFTVTGSQPTGAGLTLPSASDATMADILAILELRVGVESVAAALAAERRSDADVAALKAAAQSHVEAARTGASAAQADFHFHRAVAAASGNSYILEFVDTLGPLLIPRMRVTMPKQGDADANLKQSLDEHAAIVEAIGRQDMGGARSAMRSHLFRTIALMRDLSGT